MNRYAQESFVVWRGGGGHIPHEALEWLFFVGEGSDNL
jgi:hypothetical protein